MALMMMMMMSIMITRTDAALTPFNTKKEQPQSTEISGKSDGELTGLR